MDNSSVMTPTHCPYCALQCGMNVKSDASGVKIVPRPEFPTNRGGLCQKGWTSTELLSHPERLTGPLMRTGKKEPLQAVSWDVALDRIASEISLVQERYGRDAVGVFGGGGLTNEKAYSLGKFARAALRTANIDYNGRYCMSSAAAAITKAFGLDRGLPFPLEDIPKAETILLVGGNMAETMPPIMQHFEAQRANGGRLIVVDPRLTPTAKAATLHLQITPGTDLALANGLLHIAAAEKLLDCEFIASRTNGYDAVLRSVSSYWPDRVERITGIPVEKLIRAARMIGNASTAMVLTARGPEQQSKGTDSVLAFINLALALGKVGRAGCGFGTITGQGNGQGGREHGQKADQLPGYRRIDNPEHRAHIARVWGIDPDELPDKGKPAYELLDSCGTENGIRALFIMGSNVVNSSPRAGNIEQRIDSLDFLAVSDIFLSETAARADVVLPTAQWAEEDGTMTNLEGRVIRRKRAVSPPPGVRTDLQIIKSLADRTDRGSLFTDNPRMVFEELRRASDGGTANYAGITWERIEAEDGVFWPCPEETHLGTPRLFLERFATEDGRAQFHAVAHRDAAETPDDDYPLYLTTGRVMSQYQSGTQTRRVPSLVQTSPHAFIEIHPATARRSGITEGMMANVVTRRGTATAVARLTSTIRQDTLFMPFHWGGDARANLLTNPALDPISRMPEFKVCAARIESG